MKRAIALLLLLTLLGSPAFAYRILYKEQFYRLYRQNFYQYPERIAENIYWLEQALQADFANPLFALARIEDEAHWERYRSLFMMHVNLKIVELYLAWGTKYNKFTAYFFNYPWQRQNLESLEIAESLFNTALYYWDEALDWSGRAWDLRRLHLPQIQHWEDQNHRIETGTLDYEAIIGRHLQRLDEVRRTFRDMDDTTY